MPPTATAPSAVAAAPVLHIPDEVITVQDFANRYRVQPSVVRYWIRTGYVNATVVGARHMRLRVPDLVKQIGPMSPIDMGIPVGQFADYPLSDDYMRCKKEEAPVVDVKQREAPSSQQPTPAGQGGNSKGSHRGKKTRVW